MGQGTWGMSGEDEAMADDAHREWLREQRQETIRINARRREEKKRIKEEVAKQLKRHGIEPKEYKPRGKMVERICKCGCGKTFEAREADVKRGWGRFASKSCAAKFKDKRNGGIYRNQYGM